VPQKIEKQVETRPLVIKPCPAVKQSVKKIEKITKIPVVMKKLTLPKMPPVDVNLLPP
jgi:hypothetical protein